MDMIKFTDYGQERDLICTEQEREIFNIISEMADADLRLVRRCDNYVTAVYDDWDIARIKYTNRAKWIQFPVIDRGSTKHRIESVDDVRSMAEFVENSLSHIRKYQ